MGRQDLQARPGATCLERAVVTVILRKQKLYNSVTESQVWARDDQDVITTEAHPGTIYRSYGAGREHGDVFYISFR